MAISLATPVNAALPPAQRIFGWQTHASLALTFVVARLTRAGGIGAAQRRKSMQRADRSGASAAVRSHG